MKWSLAVTLNYPTITGVLGQLLKKWRDKGDLKGLEISSNNFN